MLAQVCSLTELDSTWSIDDLREAHIALNLREEAEAEMANRRSK